MDPELGEGLSREDWAWAQRDLIVRRVVIPAGVWDPVQTWDELHPTVGLLVLDGLVLLDFAVGRRTTTEVLGAGDLLRPWDEPPMETIPMPARWSVLEELAVVALDGRFVLAAARWPLIIESVTARATRRARWLTMRLAVHQYSRLDDRITLTLWGLAERWGRVTPGGVVVPLRLTHGTLARLVGARRPSVTAALGHLASAGVVERTPNGWLLHGDPADVLGSVDHALEAG